MTNQPADLWASSRLFLAAYTANLGPLGLGSPCLSLSCCPRRPHSPLDSGVQPQPVLLPPLPSTFPSPTDPLAESVGAICAGEVTFSLPGCYFLFTVFFLKNTKPRLTYAMLVSLSGSLSHCFTGLVYTTLHLAGGSTPLQEEWLSDLDTRWFFPSAERRNKLFKIAVSDDVYLYSHLGCSSSYPEGKSVKSAHFIHLPHILKTRNSSSYIS